MRRFYLGTHQVHWLGQVDVPLFISRVRLHKRRTFPRAVGHWALDSGGFSELTMHGRWTIDAQQYVDEVRRFSAEIGAPDWVAIQDWMCEPHLRQLTGLSTQEHQERTVDSLLELRAIAPEVPWIPILQGWDLSDYFEHVEMYEECGISLCDEPTVGVGSICRRQKTSDVPILVKALSFLGLRVHGFGLKLTALRACARYLQSSDSMAWSFDARYALPLPGHTHMNCANCIDWALAWYDKVTLAVAVNSEAEER